MIRLFNVILMDGDQTLLQGEPFTRAMSLIKSGEIHPPL